MWNPFKESYETYRERKRWFPAVMTPEQRKQFCEIVSLIQDRNVLHVFHGKDYVARYTGELFDKMAHDWMLEEPLLADVLPKLEYAGWDVQYKDFVDYNWPSLLAAAGVERIPAISPIRFRPVDGWRCWWR